MSQGARISLGGAQVVAPSEASALVSGRRSDEIANRIIALIYEGRLSPGSRLPAERTLSQQLGMSRPVLREALTRLETRGFIETRPKSGTYVCSRLPKPLRDGLEELVQSQAKWFHDIDEVRKALETHAIPTIIRKQTREQLEQLRDCLHVMERNLNTGHKAQFEKYSRADLKFHKVLARITGNTVQLHLMDFLAGLVVRAIRYSERVLSVNYGRVNVEVHRSIVAAIEARDVEGAIHAVENHYQFVERAAQAFFPERSSVVTEKTPDKSDALALEDVSGWCILKVK